jgi:hypothetical protein
MILVQQSSELGFSVCELIQQWVISRFRVSKEMEIKCICVYTVCMCMYINK